MIKLYNIFKQITEGINISDEDEYDIDYTKDTIKDIISLGDGLSYTKNNYGDTVIVGIPVQKNKNKSKLINDLKKEKNIPIEVISKLTDNIVINLTNGVDLNEFDYIIAPKSSSNLIKNFIDKLKLSTTKPRYISDFFLKNDTDKIWLDIDTAKYELSDKYLKKLIKSFDKLKGIDNQLIKLQPLTNFQRKYVKDMLKINSEYNNILIDMLDKKILVIDDILTSGKTLNDIKFLLTTLNTNEVTLFAMFG